MSKPSILVVPGGFCFPAFYDQVTQPVKAKGYDIRAISLQTVRPQLNPAIPPTTMYDDAASIAKEVEKLADEGKDVILLAHSYGGVPTSQSTKGLGKAEREAQGKTGGIVRLAYMTCVIPALGVPAQEVLEKTPPENQLKFKITEDGWAYHDPIEPSARIVFTHLPKEEGEAWVRQFQFHSVVSFANELTHAGYKDIPASYLRCELDLCIPVDVQDLGIKLIEETSGKEVDVTSIKADHCPNVSEVETVVEWILQVAAKH